MSSHVFLSVNEELGRQYQGAEISTLKGQFLYNNSRASGHQDFIQNFTLYAYPVILLLSWLVRQDIKQWKGCRECLLQKNPQIMSGFLFPPAIITSHRAYLSNANECSACAPARLTCLQLGILPQLGTQRRVLYF
jgi:hypothetical protein